MTEIETITLNSADLSPVSKFKTSEVRPTLYRVSLIKAHRLGKEHDFADAVFDELCRFMKEYNIKHLSGSLTDKTVIELAKLGFDIETSGKNNLGRLHADPSEELLELSL